MFIVAYKEGLLLTKIKGNKEELWAASFSMQPMSHKMKVFCVVGCHDLAPVCLIY
jgi:hypothetical protein